MADSDTTISPVLAERCARLLVEGEREAAQLMSDMPKETQEAIRVIIQMAKEFLNGR
jgi:hypothetical protein